jgi:hypothetical protein
MVDSQAKIGAHDPNGASMRKKLAAEEALKSQLDAMKEWVAPGTDSRSAENGVVARNVLQEELGLYGDDQPEYHLDQKTCDRLIAHTRQDAAHALVNTISLMTDVSKLEQRFRNTQTKLEQRFRNTQIGIVALFIAIVLWILWLRL